MYGEIVQNELSNLCFNFFPVTRKCSLKDNNKDNANK